MSFFHETEHHRHNDSELHDILTLLAEIAILVLIMLIWPAT